MRRDSTRTPRAALLIPLVTALFVAGALFPFLWTLLSSFKTPAQMFRLPPGWWPDPFTLENYLAVFRERDFLHNIVNSVVVAATTTAVCVVIGTLAAYAFARLALPAKRTLLGLILAISMFPQISIVTPLFLLLRRLGLINTYPALILPYLTFAMPLTVWLLTAYLRRIPAELEEAAAVDGATRLGTFTRIVLPLAAPGIFTTAILTFIYCWNEFLFALVFTTNDSARTIPVAIVMFSGYHTVPWGEILAAVVVVTVPVAAAVLVLQRRIVAGLAEGALKG